MSTCQERSAALGFRRGISRRCPNCGQGRLFRGFLAVQSTCDACRHENGAYRADDGPAYFTLLIVGHLILAPLLCFSFVWTWPLAWVLGLTLPGVLFVTLALLPFVKGAFIGVQWGSRASAG